jgi:hypothetical protein
LFENLHLTAVLVLRLEASMQNATQDFNGSSGMPFEALLSGNITCLMQVMRVKHLYHVECVSKYQRNLFMAEQPA